MAKGKTKDEHLHGKTPAEIYAEHHKDGKEPVDGKGCECDDCEQHRATLKG